MVRARHAICLFACVCLRVERGASDPSPAGPLQRVWLWWWLLCCLVAIRTGGRKGERRARIDGRKKERQKQRRMKRVDGVEDYVKDKTVSQVLR